MLDGLLGRSGFYSKRFVVVAAAAAVVAQSQSQSLSVA